MPNYGLVVTPQYNPMSYEQYVQPFKDYAQVYNQMADAYDTLEMEANQWEKLAGSDKDAPQYQQYLNYANSLREAANSLATQGLNPKTRGMVSQARQRYAKEIKPISDAWNKREEEIKFQREAKARNPYVRFNRDADNTGLSAYMGQTPQMSSIDLSQIKANVMADAKPLADELRDLQSNKLKDSRIWRSILGGQYYEAVKHYGFSSEAVSDAISQILNNYINGTENISPEQYQVLNQIVGGAINQSGVKEWDKYNNDLGFRRDVVSAAASGLWQAVGKTDFDNLQNRWWDVARRREEQAAVLEAQKPRAVEEWVFSKNQRSLLNDYNKYFSDKDKKDIGGNTILEAGTITDEGIKALEKYTTGGPSKVASVSAGVGATGTPVTQVGDRGFYDAMLTEAKNEDSRMTEQSFDELVNRANGKTGTAQQQKTAKKMLSDLYRKVQNPNDLQGTKQYVFRVNTATGDNLKKAINREVSKNELGLQEVTFDSKTKEYIPTGTSAPKTIDDDQKVIATSYSLAGNTVSVMDKDGAVHTYKMPSGIDIVSENNRDVTLKKVRAIADKIKKDGDKMSEADLRAYINKYQELIEQANLYHSQIGFVNQVENQPYSIFAQ